MANRQPVPSRDAIRALRRLALSNTAAVGGAAVGACCLLLVQYETHQRLRLAQQMVDTKKTLHSLSNGARQSHIDRMFQKAENGEDFLCRPEGAVRRLKKRNYSAVAMRSANQSDFNLDDFEQPDIPIQRLRSNLHPNHRQTSYSSQKIRRPLTGAPLATQPATQPKTDLHGLLPQQTHVHQHSSLPWSSHGDSITPITLLRPARSSDEPDMSRDETWPTAQQDTLLLNLQDALPPDLDPYIPYHGPFSFDHDQIAGFFPYGQEKEAKWTRFGMRQATCCQTIHQILLRIPTRVEQTKVLAAILRTYLATDIPEDAFLAHHLTHRFWKVSCRVPLLIYHEIEHALLRHPETLDAAMDRFYKPPGYSTPRERLEFNRRPFARARSYLEYVRSQYPDPHTVISIAAKLLQGGIDAGFGPSDQLLLPIIRHLCETGNVDLASSTLSDFSAKYGFSETFYSLSEIVRAYAAKQDWSSVDNLLDRVHAMDWSRQKALGFASLVKHILSEYARHNTSEDIYDFMSYYIRTYALFPNTQLSSIALCAFVRDRRFDLAQRWVRERDAKFSDIHDISETNQAALDVAQTWADMNASTDDILKTCQALASGAVRDPFSQSFRAVTIDAVCTELYKHCQAIQRAVHDNPEMPPVKKALDLVTAYDTAYELVSTAPTARNNPRLAIILDTVATKLRDTQEINKVVGGTYPGEYFKELDLRTPANLTSPMRTPPSPKIQNSVAAIRKSFQSGLDLYLNLEGYAKFVFEAYTKQRRQSPNARVDHSVLEEAVKELSQHNRQHDALTLIRSVYRSDYVKDTGFGYKLYMRWLDLTIQMRHPQLFREACWAVIDDPNTKLPLDAAFNVQVLIGAYKCHRNSVSRVIDQYQWNEAFYLLKRISRRILDSHGIKNFIDGRGLWEWSPTGALDLTEHLVAAGTAGGLSRHTVSPDSIENSIERGKKRDQF